MVVVSGNARSSAFGILRLRRSLRKKEGCCLGWGCWDSRPFGPRLDLDYSTAPLLDCRLLYCSTAPLLQRWPKTTCWFVLIVRTLCVSAPASASACASASASSAAAANLLSLAFAFYAQRLVSNWILCGMLPAQPGGSFGAPGLGA